MNDPQHGRRSNRSLTLRLAALAVAMFGFGYLLVPFYYLMCEVVGIGGRPSSVAAAAPRHFAVRRLDLDDVRAGHRHEECSVRPLEHMAEIEDAQREGVNREWLKMFPDPQSRPARHAMQSPLDGEKLLECDFIAVLG